MTSSPTCEAAVSLYGISDLRTIREGFAPDIQAVHASPAVTEALLANGPAFADGPGAPIWHDPAKALAASATGHLDGAKPPMLLMYGSADELVSPLQSRQLFEALRARGNPVDHVLVDGTAHGRLPWYPPALMERVTGWFAGALGGPASNSGGTPDAASEL